MREHFGTSCAGASGVADAAAPAQIAPMGTAGKGPAARRAKSGVSLIASVLTRSGHWPFFRIILGLIWMSPPAGAPKGRHAWKKRMAHRSGASRLLACDGGFPARIGMLPLYHAKADMNIADPPVCGMC